MTPFSTAVKAALDEARQRGDRRMGTEHLLLGLLRDPDSEVARALGVSLDTARAGLDALDRAALSAIGIDVGEVPDRRPRRHPRIPGTNFTSTARAVVNQALKETTMRTRGAQAPKHVLLVLLDQQPPDPVAALIDELGVDRAEVRARLA
ncbi:Clp protease N-terminal domain-containing protein [Nonomuraea sp. NPDC050536]|uniref:Clp protease N-terminal domain-containing protein n=1 Tax=Nonomuraea sp. NPDC050536 TaxID=3364366 RepID=UPI0037CC8C0F